MTLKTGVMESNSALPNRNKLHFYNIFKQTNVLLKMEKYSFKKIKIFKILM